MLVPRLISAAALLSISLLSRFCFADNFVYSVATHFSDFQVDGTITTATNVGVLTFGDIADFNLLLTSVAGSETLTLSNALNSGLYGYALTATPAGLFFDYGEPSSGLFFNNPATGSHLCFQTSGCDSGADAHQSISVAGTTYSAAQSGVVQIAAMQADAPLAVTPEPSSFLLLGTGALAVFGVWHRRLYA